MAVPLVLKGNLFLGVTAVPTADVSAEVTSFKIKASRDLVDVPATLAGPKSARAGGASYEIEIGYLADDSASTTLFSLLWDAIASASGMLYFMGSMSDDVVSATNPQWQGQFVVTGAELGGAAEGLAAGSVTCRMIAAPVRDITP